MQLLSSGKGLKHILQIIVDKVGARLSCAENKTE